MSKPHILISGAGICGPVCAFWLSKWGFLTTVIERSNSLRTTGQQVDIRGSGLTVIRRMGLEDIVKAKTTQEKGLAFVNTSGKRIGSFPVEPGGMSFTSEFEILRGELSKILYDSSKAETNYIFGDHITGIEEVGDKIKVHLANGGEKEFDLLVGADGMHSKTRRLLFPSANPLKHIGQYTAYFTMPLKQSMDNFAEWYNAPGGRQYLLRPDNTGNTRAHISIISTVPKDYLNLDTPAQKRMMRELFSDAGWETGSVLDAMDKADDFYMQEIAQVKLDHWFHGRVALIGDAGYCPSAVSGMGTSLAIVGGYVLAGELSRCKGDWKQGLELYEKRMRPYVEKAQHLSPGVPALANPQTKWGIAILNGIVRTVHFSGLGPLLGKLAGPDAEDKTLPLYDEY